MPISACSAICDDGDHCTIDGCDAGGGCVHVDQPPTVPGGVLCGVANARDIMSASPMCNRGCVRWLEHRLDVIDRRVRVGEAPTPAARCRRALRGAVRAARLFDRRTAKLVAHGRLVPARRADSLERAASDLHRRADVLSRGFCAGR